MSAALITAKGLGKRYRIGTRIVHNTLRDHIAAGWRRLGRAREGGDAQANRQPQGHGGGTL